MEIQGTEIFHSENEHDPLCVVDVEGHNVLIYAEKSIWPDRKTDTLKPQLTVRAEVPSITTVGRSDLRYDTIMRVLAYLKERLERDFNVHYSNVGLELTLKNVEHVEKEHAEYDLLDSHPAFFESRDEFRRQLLDCLEPAKTKVRELLDVTRSNLELLSSEPEASEAVVEIASGALRDSRTTWSQTDQSEQIVDGETYFVPSRYTGIASVEKKSLPKGVSDAAIDHGFRTLFANHRLNMSVTKSREFDEAYLFWLQSTPDSYEKLRKIFWKRSENE